ncbi:MAG: hypothetical protein IT437_05910 [Phycisphaerales bacterium]|nr:hypothetical protein [Phycisphaerales bacterium]
MRLPISKPWRAFPELDRYTDQQCERFLAEAHTSQRRLMMISHAMVAAVIVGGVAAGIALVSWTHDVLWRRFGTPAIIAVALSPVAVLPVIVVMLSRRTHRLLLFRELGRWRDAGHPECPRCNYPLVELPERDCTKTCPECGYVVELAR